MIAGRDVDGKFSRERFLGSGFFVSTFGLAFTAGHVIAPATDGSRPTAALYNGDGQPLLAHETNWSVELPNSDIAAMRVQTLSPSFEVAFREVDLGEELQTISIPDFLMETDAAGSTQFIYRAARGYVAQGVKKSVMANFALPAGMSGSPAIVARGDFHQVFGVLVGQTRSEIVEDQLEEVTEAGVNGTVTRVERVARAEYLARIDLLNRYKDFVAPEFEGMTLSQLID